jgi:hypothetical protein
MKKGAATKAQLLNSKTEIDEKILRGSQIADLSFIS